MTYTKSKTRKENLTMKFYYDDPTEVTQTDNEDNLNLSIELIPESAWHNNLRTVLTKEDWDTLRRYVYKRAGYECQICGSVGDDWPVECHEVWAFTIPNGYPIQGLIDLIALCPMCHRVKHIGRSFSEEDAIEVFNHFCNINKLTFRQAEGIIARAKRRCFERGQHKWTLSIDRLNLEYDHVIDMSKY